MVSMYEAMNLAINFAVFTLTFIGVVIAIVTLFRKEK